MTTFNIETSLPTGKLHKRQSGLWGQLLASAEIEAKLARVEPLFKELHGTRLNRSAFFSLCREMARESKADAGGYLQYMTQDVAGVVLKEWHTEIGKQVRRNRKLKNTDLRADFIVTEIGKFNIQSNDFARKPSGVPASNRFATLDSKTYKLYKAMKDRTYPVTKATLMKASDIKSAAHFYDTLRVLRGKGHSIDTVRTNHMSVAPTYKLVG